MNFINGFMDFYNNHFFIVLFVVLILTFTVSIFGRRASREALFDNPARELKKEYGSAPPPLGVAINIGSNGDITTRAVSGGNNVPRSLGYKPKNLKSADDKEYFLSSLFAIAEDVKEKRITRNEGNRRINYEFPYIGEKKRFWNSISYHPYNFFNDSLDYDDLFSAISSARENIVARVPYYNNMGGLNGATVSSAGAPQPDRNTITYHAVMDKEKSIRSSYFAYVDSIEKSLQYPMMRDTSHKLIIDLNYALSRAYALRPESDAVASVDNAYNTDYGKAVSDLERAFIAAEGTAKRMRLTFLSETEQKDVVTAQRLLSIALNESSSPNERQTAYKKVLKIMDDLSMPATPNAKKELESHNGNKLLSAIGR